MLNHYRTLLLNLPPDGEDVAEEKIPAAFVPGLTGKMFAQFALVIAGALLIAEEALTRNAVNTLRVALEEQPVWSDLPVVVFSVMPRRKRPETTRIIATRSRCFGSMFAWILNTKPVTLFS